MGNLRMPIRLLCYTCHTRSIVQVDFRVLLHRWPYHFRFRLGRNGRICTFHCLGTFVGIPGHFEQTGLHLKGFRPPKDTPLAPFSSWAKPSKTPLTMTTKRNAESCLPSLTLRVTYMQFLLINSICFPVASWINNVGHWHQRPHINMPRVEAVGRHGRGQQYIHLPHRNSRQANKSLAQHAQYTG